MAWKDGMLRVFAAGIRDAHGERLDLDVVMRALDRIDADAALAARLDALQGHELRRAFLEIYAETAG